MHSGLCNANGLFRCGDDDGDDDVALGSDID